MTSWLATVASRSATETSTRRSEQFRHGSSVGIQLGHRLEGEAALVEARVRHDDVVLRIGHAHPVEGEDVEVDRPRAPARRPEVPAERLLQALQLGEQVDR